MRKFCLLASYILFVIFGGQIIAGCAHRYPESESRSGFTYPLKVCNRAVLAAANAQVQNPLGQLDVSERTFCKTETTAGVTPGAGGLLPVRQADPNAGPRSLRPIGCSTARSMRSSRIRTR